MRNCTCRSWLAIFVSALFFTSFVNAQSTAFNYQGNLTDASQPANGSDGFEFSLFDALEGGSQVGSTVTRTNVQVTDGSFSVSLDFGGEFPGAGRWLEIRSHPAGKKRALI